MDGQPVQADMVVDLDTRRVSTPGRTELGKRVHTVLIGRNLTLDD